MLSKGLWFIVIMEEFGSEAKKLVEFLNKKSTEQVKVSKLMEEYESLEAVLEK